MQSAVPVTPLVPVIVPLPQPALTAAPMAGKIAVLPKDFGDQLAKLLPSTSEPVAQADTPAVPADPPSVPPPTAPVQPPGKAPPVDTPVVSALTAQNVVALPQQPVPPLNPGPRQMTPPRRVTAAPLPRPTSVADVQVTQMPAPPAAAIVPAHVDERPSEQGAPPAAQQHAAALPVASDAATSAPTAAAKATMQPEGTTTEVVSAPVSPPAAEALTAVPLQPPSAPRVDVAAQVLPPPPEPAPPATAAAAPAATAAVSTPQAPSSPAAQIAPALVQMGHAPDGSQRLTVRLDPPDLGQVQVRIDRPAEAPARVEITVEKPETLTLLLRDQPQLQRALDQAGVPAEGRSVTFHVASPEPSPRSEPVTAPAPSVASGGLSGDGAHGAPRQSGQQPTRQQAEAEDSGDAEFAPLAAPDWIRAGLDITA